MNQQATIPEGYMQDSAGRLVPEANVRDEDKLRDQVVTDLVNTAQRLSRELSEFKTRALADIQDLIQCAAANYEVDLGGKKGNVTLTSYNGQYRIQRVYQPRITFTEELLAAQELFTKCLNRWTEGADNNIRALVDRAFRTSRNNQIRTSELLGLLRLEIDDPDWILACQALKDSISTDASTVYLRVYQRIEDSDHYRLIPLDLAGVSSHAN